MRDMPTPVRWLMGMVIFVVVFFIGVYAGEHGGTDVVFHHDCKTMLHGVGHGDLCIKDGRVVGHM